MRAGRLLALLPCLGITVAGCSWIPGAPQEVPVAVFFGDHLDTINVHRIMVLPFKATDEVDADAGEVRSAFLNELLKLRRFDVVPLPSNAEDHHLLYNRLTHGKYAKEVLVDLARRYEVDGVLAARITSYRAYDPVNLGISFRLISLHTGTVIWAADAIYDMNDLRIVEDLKHYAQSFAIQDASMHGWRMHALAPNKFASYVSHRIVGTWNNR